jgi:hypothetical protein
VKVFPGVEIFSRKGAKGQSAQSWEIVSRGEGGGKASAACTEVRVFFYLVVFA